MEYLRVAKGLRSVLERSTPDVVSRELFYFVFFCLRACSLRLCNCPAFSP
jgi:hypothetical protein